MRSLRTPNGDRPTSASSLAGPLVSAVGQRIRCPGGRRRGVGFGFGFGVLAVSISLFPSAVGVRSFSPFYSFLFVFLGRFGFALYCLARLPCGCRPPPFALRILHLALRLPPRVFHLASSSTSILPPTLFVSAFFCISTLTGALCTFSLIRPAAQPSIRSVLHQRTNIADAD